MILSPMVKAVVLILVVLLLLLTGAIWAGNMRLSAAFGDMSAQLPAGATALRTDLPDVVASFARRNGGGQTGICAQHLTQSGGLRRKKGGDFGPMLAQQRMSLVSTGFVWSAKAPVAPVSLIRVIDRYVGGRGGLDVWLMGLIHVAEAKGDAVDLSEAMRYLAELPWMPDAILRNHELEWQQLDERRVSVAVPVGQARAEVTFEFDAGGDITTVTALGRPSVEDGQVILRDWRGIFSDYRQVGPRRIPVRGQVGYEYDDGFEIYFDGAISGLRLEACSIGPESAF